MDYSNFERTKERDDIRVVRYRFHDFLSKHALIVQKLR